jgi:hypothetical protein
MLLEAALRNEPFVGELAVRTAKWTSPIGWLRDRLVTFDQVVAISGAGAAQLLYVATVSAIFDGLDRPVRIVFPAPRTDPLVVAFLGELVFADLADRRYLVWGIAERVTDGREFFVNDGEAARQRLTFGNELRDFSG